MTDSIATDTVEGRIAFAHAELARLEARDAAVRLAPRRVRRQTGGSIVYSVRLDPAEVAALEERAERAGIKPTALARNLIRVGLSAAHGAEVVDAVDRLDAVVQELRTFVGGRTPPR